VLQNLKPNYINLQNITHEVKIIDAGKTDFKKNALELNMHL